MDIFTGDDRLDLIWALECLGARQDPNFGYIAVSANESATHLAVGDILEWKESHPEGVQLFQFSQMPEDEVLDMMDTLNSLLGIPVADLLRTVVVTDEIIIIVETPSGINQLIQTLCPDVPHYDETRTAFIEKESCTNMIIQKEDDTWSHPYTVNPCMVRLLVFRYERALAQQVKILNEQV